MCSTWLTEDTIHNMDLRRSDHMLSMTNNYAASHLPPTNNSPSHTAALHNKFYTENNVFKQPNTILFFTSIINNNQSGCLETYGRNVTAWSMRTAVTATFVTGSMS